MTVARQRCEILCHGFRGRGIRYPDQETLAVPRFESEKAKGCEDRGYHCSSPRIWVRPVISKRRGTDSHSFHNTHIAERELMLYNPGCLATVTPNQRAQGTKSVATKVL